MKPPAPTIALITLCIAAAEPPELDWGPAPPTHFVVAWQESSMDDSFWEAGFSYDENQCPTNFYVTTRLTPSITHSNGWYYIKFIE